MGTNRAEYQRAWRKKNLEKTKLYQRKHRKKNNDKIKKYNKEWREKNKEKRNAQARREYAKRSEHYIAKAQNYLDRKNPARIIRRLIKQFRCGDIDRDELINGINAALNFKDETNE